MEFPISQPKVVRLPRNEKQTYRLNSRPQMWPMVWIYQIVTGVTSVVGVPSTHLVCAAFVLYLVRPSLVDISETILLSDGISFGFWLNVRFAVNYRWTFRSLTIDIAIDLFPSEDQYFLWITAVPLCVYNPNNIQNTPIHVRYATLCLGKGFKKTMKFCRNYRVKYEIITEYRCITMWNTVVRALARHFEKGVLNACGTHCKHNY